MANNYFGTTVRYNGVEMHNVVTRQWEQEVVYDQSNTDALYQKFKLRFEGIIHLGQKEGTALRTTPAWTGAESASIPINESAITSFYSGIRLLLERPRGVFEVSCGDSVIFRCSPSLNQANLNGSQPEGSLKEPNRDVDNGPKPKAVNLLGIIGGKVLKVSFAIECAKLEWIDQSGNKTGYVPGTVLSNRWTVEEMMDDNWFTTRTVRGRIRIAAACDAIHSSRSLVVPYLEPGFRRDRVEYVVAANGLEADYTVVDRQVHTAAPWPATKIDGTYSESTADGVTYVGEVHVTLEGPPDADKRLLFNRIVHVIDAKLQYQKKKFNADYMVEGAALIEHIGERNVVEGRLRIRHQFQDPTAYLLNVVKETMGAPLELPPINGKHYNSQVSETPPLYGCATQSGSRSPAVVALLNCYLQSPYNGSHAIYAKNNAGQTGVIAVPAQSVTSGRPAQDVVYLQGGPTETIVVGEMLTGALQSSDVTLQYSDSTREAVYTVCRAESEYIQPQCKVQMPLAGPWTAGQDTSAIFSLANPQCQRVIRVDCERVGKWPELPTPLQTYKDNNLVGTLLKHKIRVHPPTLSADGSKPLYRVAAYYLYAMNRPPMLNESIRIGVLPFTKFEQANPDMAFTPNKLYTARLNP